MRSSAVTVSPAAVAAIATRPVAAAAGSANTAVPSAAAVASNDSVPNVSRTGVPGSTSPTVTATGTDTRPIRGVSSVSAPAPDDATRAMIRIGIRQRSLMFLFRPTGLAAW